jgi:nucleoside-diphosphate-sugar epimerase
MTAQLATKSAFVTGATGFIGSHLTAHLRNAGWRVGILARPETIEKNGLRRAGAVYAYRGLTDEVIDAVTDFRPDVVFHLASLFLVAHSPEQIVALVQSNVLFGTQLLEGMSQAGCTALVNAGTAWQNYTPEPPFDSQNYMPVNLYAATKQAFEDIAAFYVESAGLRLVTLRLFDTYGPGDKRRKLVRLLIDTLMTGQPLEMSPGDQTLDLVHVEDICRAFLHAGKLTMARSEAGAKVFAVGSTPRLTLRQVVATFEEAAQRKLPIEFGKRPYRSPEVMHPWEGPALPGWEPTISLLDGIRNVIAQELG